MYEKEPRMFYDQIDVSNAYRSGFWIGSVSTLVLTLVLFVGIGLYLH